MLVLLDPQNVCVRRICKALLSIVKASSLHLIESLKSYLNMYIKQLCGYHRAVDSLTHNLINNFKIILQDGGLDKDGVKEMKGNK